MDVRSISGDLKVFRLQKTLTEAADLQISRLKAAMFTELNSILNTTPDSFTQGEFVLLSDRRSDASFLIHHFLSLYLRGELTPVNVKN
ncbi:Elongator complex protein 6 [Liparis tanakae]|uniref:Elongator complex protein 6 n=1 Tax=Liparis tanakae TaxID=230148 RepID=A0A4Z2ERS6_9TELE|nr:Elongator complex protein 6 [Liparis tanakae]